MRSVFDIFLKRKKDVFINKKKDELSPTLVYIQCRDVTSSSNSNLELNEEFLCFLCLTVTSELLIHELEIRTTVTLINITKTRLLCSSGLVMIKNRDTFKDVLSSINYHV